MSKHFYFHSPLYKKLLFNFVLLVLLPTLIFVLFYTGKINKVLESEVTRNNANSVEISQKELEIVFNSVFGKGLNIALYDQVQSLLEEQNRDNTHNYAYVDIINSIQQYITNQLVTEQDVHSIYVYNTTTQHIVVPFKERIISSNIDAFYDTAWLDGIYDMEYLKVLPLRKPVDPTYDKDTLDFRTNVNSNVITLLYPIRWLSNDIKGVLVVNLYETIIPPSIKSGSVLILDRDFEVVYPMDLDKKYFAILNSLKKKELLYPLHLKSKEAMEYRYNNVRYIIDYAAVSSGNLYLMKMSSFEEVYRDIKYYQIVVLLLAFITLIFGLVYSLNTVWKIYNPVQATLSMLNINNRDNTEKNELEMILNEVNTTMEQNKTVHEILKNQEQNIKHGLVLKLLRGDVETDVSLLQLQEVHSCLLISIDNFRDLVNNHSLKDQYSYKTLILQMAQKNIRKYCHGIGIHLQDDKILFILSYSKNQRESIAFDEMVQSIQQIITSISDVTLTCCFGKSYSSIDQIRTSYLESLVTLKYRMTYGHNSIIFYEAIKNNERCDLQKDMEQVNVIINYLNVKDKEQIIKVLHSYINKLRACKVVSSDNIMEFFYPLIHGINTYLNKQHGAIREQLGFNESLYSMISHKETLQDVEKMLLFIIEKIIDHELDNKNDNITHVIQYINEHYTDSNLDVTKLSDIFHISYSYLRKRIKAYTGSTFIHYINELRIKHSKELLLTSSLSIKEISIHSGYNSEQSYLRNFKKYEGITPTAFRLIKH